MMRKFDIKGPLTAFRAYRMICRGEHVLLTHRNKPIMGVVPVNDLNMLESMQQERLKDVDDEFDLGILDEK